MCSRVSGSNVKIELRLNSGELMAKNGFCVVAPMRMTRPSSTMEPHAYAPAPDEVLHALMHLEDTF